MLRIGGELRGSAAGLSRKCVGSRPRAISRFPMASRGLEIIARGMPVVVSRFTVWPPSCMLSGKRSPSSSVRDPAVTSRHRPGSWWRVRRAWEEAGDRAWAPPWRFGKDVDPARCALRWHGPDRLGRRYARRWLESCLACGGPERTSRYRDRTSRKSQVSPRGDRPLQGTRATVWCSEHPCNNQAS